MGRLSQSIAGDGSWKFKCLGIILWFNEESTLIRAAMPAADSRCPKFVFTDPMYRGLPASRSPPKTEAIPCSSIGSPTGVPVP